MVQYSFNQKLFQNVACCVNQNEWSKFWSICALPCPVCFCKYSCRFPVSGKAPCSETFVVYSSHCFGYALL